MLALLPLLGPILERLTALIPDPAARERAIQQATTEMVQTLIASDNGQAQTNTAEASNPSIFVAGWRPAAGWVSVAGLVYAFIAQPIASVWVPGLPVPGEELWTLLFGMLGLGALRSFDKVRGVATPGVVSR